MRKGVYSMTNMYVVKKTRKAKPYQVSERKTNNFVVKHAIATEISNNCVDAIAQNIRGFAQVLSVEVMKGTR